MPQELDEEHWRPITFEGIEFPASLMGVDILFHEDRISDDAAQWLVKLCTCKGYEKSSGAAFFLSSSRNVIDFLEGSAELAIERIHKSLAGHNFHPNVTLSEWIESLKRIEMISANVTGDCHWIAPSHDSDSLKSKEDARKLMDAIDRSIAVDE